MENRNPESMRTLDAERGRKRKRERESIFPRRICKGAEVLRIWLALCPPPKRRVRHCDNSVYLPEYAEVLVAASSSEVPGEEWPAVF